MQAKEEIKVFPEVCRKYFQDVIVPFGIMHFLIQGKEAQINVQEACGLVFSSRFVSLVNQVPHWTMFCMISNLKTTTARLGERGDVCGWSVILLRPTFFSKFIPWGKDVKKLFCWMFSTTSSASLLYARVGGFSLQGIEEKLCTWDGMFGKTFFPPTHQSPA